MTLIWREMSLTCNSRIDEDVGKYEEGAQLSIKASYSHGLLFNLFSQSSKQYLLPPRLLQIFSLNENYTIA